MGARKCVVPGCQSCTTKPEDKKLTYHRFPVHFRDTWLKVLKLPPNFTTTKNTHICSRHFEKSDFQAFKGKKYFLKHGAIPKINHVSTAQDLKPDETKMETDEIPSTSATTTATEETKEEIKVEEEKVTEAEERKVEEPETPKPAEPAEVKEEIKVELEPVKVEEKKDEIVAAVPVLPVFSPKKQRRSAIKRFSDTSTPIAQPSKKIPRKSSPGASSAKKQKASKSTPVKSEPSETKAICNPSPKKKNAVISFVPGSTLEAQDFDGKWNAAKVIEVDTEEREVLVRFASAKSKTTGMNEEWIPMDSSRLRAAQPLVTFEVGEKCLARWSDSRKFPATIQKVLENEAYEVVFDDGYIKVVRGVHIFKVPKSGKESNIQPLLSLPVQGLIPDYVRNVPIPEVKNDGEWCCAWVDDIPIGEESSFDSPFGRVSSIIVPDDRVKEGWQKHVYLRPSGKWDVVFISPMGKKIRFKSELKAHLEEVGEPYDPEKYDFSLHKKRSKVLGLYIYSDKLKKESINMFDSKQNLNTNLTQSTINHLASLGALPTLPSTVAMSVIPTPRESEIHIGSLKIKVIDKLYLCPQETCDKTFRRQNVLQIHIKHYHPEIFKMTGVCPNMTDLAYLRTTGDEVEVPVPKPSTPKTKPSPSVTPKRTSTATSSTPKIKVEQQEVDQKVAEIKKELKREGLLGTIPMQFKESPKPAKTTQRSPILEEALKAPPLLGLIKDEITIEKEVIQVAQKPIPADMVDPESLITSHAVSKTGVVKTTHGSALKKRSKIRFGTKPKKISKKRRYELQNKPYQKLKVYKEPKIKKEPGVSGLVQTKMEPTSEAGFYPLSRKKKKLPKGLIPYQSNAGYYNSGDGAWSKAYDSQGSYIDENGEVIKIVRMRKEEIINCVCGFVEEDGLMIQCELCLCWQHGGCNFIYKENQVPEKYVCLICKNPTKARNSQKYSHDQDWLFDGKLPIANYHVPNPKQTQRFENLKQCHTLIGNMVEMKRFMHSLDVKINIAEKRGHPKMYLWSKKWESSPPRQVQGNGSEIDSKKNIKKELKFEEDSETVPKFVAPSAPEPEAAIDPAKCQKILLGHIQEQQKIVRNRLDDIEKHIRDLETAEDVKDLKMPDSDAKMKQTIFMLLNDLTKMRKVASIHSIPGV